MMSTSNHTKLNPIYAAIDAHQYNRAIKLASSLPDSNVLGKALLAHSYTISGQKRLALIALTKVLNGTLSPPSFFELQSVLEQQSNGTSSSSPSPSPSPSSFASSKVESVAMKKGKKGKKKPTLKQQQQQQRQKQQPVDEIQPQSDLIDRLDIPPSIPEKFDTLSIFSTDHQPTDIITDETTLATLAVSLKSLNLPLTAYQMYALAAETLPTKLTLTKTFNFGLSFLASSSKWGTESRSKLEIHVLSRMQTVALQLARVAVSSQDDLSLMLATAWACQSALWQLEWLAEDDQRLSILPRLAESMGRRLLQQEGERNQWSKEIRLLCLRTLRRQSKWNEMLQILESIPITNSTNFDNDNATGDLSEFGVTLPQHQIKLQIAELLKKLDRFVDARLLYENFLHTNPDDWFCWKAHLECSMLINNDSGLTQALVKKVINDRIGSRCPLRGPHLMIVEIAIERLRQDGTDDTIRNCGDAIRQYAEIFAHRANCAFTDLAHYLSILMRKENDDINRDVTISLLEFAESLRRTNKTSRNIVYSEGGIGTSNKERQAKLRAYIFALKVTHKLLSGNIDLADKYLPDWIEIVREWQATLSLSSSNEGEETQRELKPGDDLILLTVQQLLFKKDSENDCGDPKFISAVLLESGIQHSPDNAYLKFVAIEVYHQLNATTRSWELFQTIGLKHIQLDSCSFVIFPYLFEGGLYNEAIDICLALLRFQGGTARDCGDYTGRAMNSGILTKANEFMVFQRQKMNQSLTSLYCKGLILDAAPLLASEVPRMKDDDDPILKGSIGITQGIVGGNEDIERATKMVAEIYNPCAALSVVSYLDRFSDNNIDYLSDNRDISILNQNAILLKPRIESKRRMVQATLRRGHIHGILIRAALCVDAMKGPKKGKVVKPSTVLEKRTQSLLDSVLEASEFFDSEIEDGDTNDIGCRDLLHIFLNLCRVLAVVNAGMPKIDEDSMEQREHQSVNIIQHQVLMRMKLARKFFSLTSNPKTVGFVLPNYILPIFAVFRMCSTVCTSYGWGKRKMKKVSVVLADFSEEFKGLLKDNLMTDLRILPTSDTESSLKYSLNEIETNVLDKDVVRGTKILLNRAQCRTRMRMEPILEEMIFLLEE